jgi:hypothetical protein
MHRQPRTAMIVLALAGAAGLLGSAPASAKKTCRAVVDAATKQYSGALIQKAASACAKKPGGTCFRATVPSRLAPSAKKLKLCTNTDITTVFGGHCISRDTSCSTITVTTADDAARCIKCNTDAEVVCLAATAFATASVPASCLGSE